MKEINHFEDWVNYMLNQTDYNDSEIMDFKDHYQNLLSYEDNLKNFEVFLGE